MEHLLLRSQQRRQRLHADHHGLPVAHCWPHPSSPGLTWHGSWPGASREGAIDPAGPPNEIQVEAQSDLPPGSAELARTKVLALLDEVREPVLSVRIRLTRMHNPATDRPYLAQANLDVNGPSPIPST